MPKLYDFELSPECYQVRLLASLLHVGLEIVPVDAFPGREHRRAPFLALNPLGEVPVLVEDELVLRDSVAILVHLARRHDPAGTWFPVGPAAPMAELQAWLGFSRRLALSVTVARDIIATGFDADLEACQAEGHRLLRVLDEHLWFARRAGQDGLCEGGRPSVADIACFCHVVLCEEGGVSRQDYPAVRLWLDQVKRLDGFIVMSGVFPAGPAPAPR